MKTAVRYFTRTGHTQKLAEAVASTLGVKALPVSQGLTEDVDVLFLASSVYAAGVAGEVKKFIAGIDVAVGEVVNVSSAALIESTYEQVKKHVESKGLKMSNKEYHCRGALTMLHRGHPNKDDIQGAAEFAKAFV